MNLPAAVDLLTRLQAEHGPGVLNDLALAAFFVDTKTEQDEGDDATELLRDWCADLCEQLESCL